MLRGEFLESFQAVLGLGHHGTVDSCDECSRAVTRCIRTCLPCAGLRPKESGSDVARVIGCRIEAQLLMLGILGYGIRRFLTSQK